LFCYHADRPYEAHVDIYPNGNVSNGFRVVFRDECLFDLHGCRLEEPNLWELIEYVGNE